MLSTCENYLEISGPPKKLVFEEFYSSYFILKHLVCSHIHKNLFFLKSISDCDIGTRDVDK